MNMEGLYIVSSIEPQGSGGRNIQIRVRIRSTTGIARDRYIGAEVMTAVAMKAYAM